MNLTTLSLIAATATLGLGGGALAAGDDMAALVEKAFGSTIVSTYPDGRQGELWLQRDGSYTASGRRLNMSDGSWQIKGDKLCLKQRRPIPAPFSFCTPIPTSGLDKPWEGRAYTGERISIRVVKGLHGRSPPARNAGDPGKDEAGRG
jgi:hypothetical protein